jgi:uncharacterized repeat protein (TIGR01451 family)
VQQEGNDMLPKKHHRNHGSRRFIVLAAVAVVVLAGLLNSTPFVRTVSAAPGDVDLSFGENGDVVLSGQWSVTRTSVQPDGKIVVAYGNRLGQSWFLFLSRYSPGGELEWRHFVPGSVHPVSGNGPEILRVLIRPDGKIVVAHQKNSISGIVLFDTGGSFETTISAGPNDLEDVGVLPDNQLVVMGRNELRLYDAGGELVRVVSLSHALWVGFGRLAVGPDARIVVSSPSPDLPFDTYLARYHADLTADNSFCSGGTCVFPLQHVAHLKILKDNKIIVGNFRQIYRLLPSGDLDTGFGASGIYDNPGLDMLALEVDDRDRLVVIGQQSFMPFFDVKAIEANGIGTFVTFHVPGSPFSVHALQLQHDGKVLVTVVQPDFAAGTVSTLLRRYHYTDEGRLADLRIDTTQIRPEAVRPRDVIEYSIEVANAGPDRAGHVTFENLIPDGTTFVDFTPPEDWVTYQRPFLHMGKVSCSGYSLSPRQTVTFRLRVQVRPNVRRGTVITNRSSIHSLVRDISLSSNASTSTVTVQ